MWKWKCLIVEIDMEVWDYLRWADLCLGVSVDSSHIQLWSGLTVVLHLPSCGWVLRAMGSKGIGSGGGVSQHFLNTMQAFYLCVVSSCIPRQVPTLLTWSFHFLPFRTSQEVHIRHVWGFFLFSLDTGDEPRSPAWWCANSVVSLQRVAASTF